MSTLEDFKEDFFALSPDIIGLVGLDGYFSYVSPAVNTILGYTQTEFISRPLMSYLHPEDINLLINEYHSFITGKKEFSIANRWKHKNGTYRYLIWKASPKLKDKIICTIGRDITDIVHSQEELQRFFNLSRDLMCTASFNGYFLQVNPSFERELGYTAEELINSPFVQYIHPDDIKSTLIELDRLKEGKMDLQFENRFRHRNGLYKTLSWKAYSTLEENKIHATARDITELRKARSDLEIKVNERTEKLSRSQAFLNSLIENMPNMVFVKEAKNLTFIRFNKAGEDLLGYKVEDLYGKNDFDFFTKSEAEFFTSNDRKVLSGKSIVNIPEEEISTKYRGTRILHTKKIPIYDSEGNPEYLLGISEDITEIKLAERERIKLLKNQAILEERERISKREAFLAETSNILASSLNFRETLNKLADFVIPKMADWGTITIKNEEGKLERIASIHSDKATNRMLQELSKVFPPDPRKDAFFTTAMDEHKSVYFPVITPEMLSERIDDENLLEIISALGCYSTIMVPIVNRGKTLGIITLNNSTPDRIFSPDEFHLAEDIGKKTGVVIENALLYAAARMAIKSRDDFISIASHELKTPITSLKLQLQMTKRGVHVETGKTLSAEKLMKVLDFSNQQIDRLTALVEDLLDVTRIESGKIRYHFEEFDFSQLVAEIVDRYRDLLTPDGISINFTMPQPILINGDRYRIEQVIINLLTNASKYGEQKPIVVVLKEDQNTAFLEVTDHGIGIDPGYLEKVFEKFERVVSHHNISGLGLGLYISKEIVLAHKGSINAKSEVNEGTTFTVCLPKALQH